jgi:hypothetical protein
MRFHFFELDSQLKRFYKMEKKSPIFKILQFRIMTRWGKSVNFRVQGMEFINDTFRVCIYGYETSLSGDNEWQDDRY